MRKLLIVVFLAVGAIAALGIVRSKILADERALKTAAIQYSTLRRIYAHPANSEPAAGVSVE
jgi:hypothetical protein